jgi:hypothetical protein
MFWNPQVSASVRIQTERVATQAQKKYVYYIQCRSFVLHTTLWGNLSDAFFKLGSSKMYYGSVNGSLGTVLIPAIGHHPQNDGNTVRSDTQTG